MNVVRLAEPAHVLNFVFSTLLNPTSVFVTVSQIGAVAVPVVVATERKNLRVVVVLPPNLANVFAALLYKISPIV